MERSFSRKKFILVSILIFLLVAGGLVFYLLTEYKVTDVLVEGNIHYTDQEIREMVLPGGLKDNSLYLRLYFRNRKMEDIPFVETMDVEIMTHHMIKVAVYEKALAGCIEYLGKYMYFDKDGVVVEASEQTTPGVPQIKGLQFDSVMLHEPLPVGNPDIFSEILKVTQLLSKYSLTADQIFFSNKGNVTLYFGDVRVDMGGEANVDEKVMELREIIPHLEGKSGILHMENFNKETTTVTFVPDDAPGVYQEAKAQSSGDQAPDLFRGITLDDGTTVTAGQEETSDETQSSESSPNADTRDASLESGEAKKSDTSAENAADNAAEKPAEGGETKKSDQEPGKTPAQESSSGNQSNTGNDTTSVGGLDLPEAPASSQTQSSEPADGAGTVQQETSVEIPQDTQSDGLDAGASVF